MSETKHTPAVGVMETDIQKPETDADLVALLGYYEVREIADSERFQIVHVSSLHAKGKVYAETQYPIWAATAVRTLNAPVQKAVAEDALADALNALLELTDVVEDDPIVLRARAALALVKP